MSSPDNLGRPPAGQTQTGAAVEDVVLDEHADALGYHDPEPLYDALRPLEPGGQAPMALLKATWIVAQGKKLRAAKKRRDADAVRALAIKPRQQMEADVPDAYMTLDEVKKHSKKIDSYNRRLAAGGVSYCWETREHPDPEGNSLLALADAIEECHLQKREERYGRYGGFPSEMGIFWDFPCLFQHPPGGTRTADEDKLFKWALDHLELIYAHEVLFSPCSSCSLKPHLEPPLTRRLRPPRAAAWRRPPPSGCSQSRRRPRARRTTRAAGRATRPLPRASARGGVTFCGRV